ncbi:hypothetical protein BH11BAC1_BH11BAC1_21430 [soil metagenome]
MTAVLNDLMTAAFNTTNSHYTIDYDNLNYCSSC